MKLLTIHEATVEEKTMKNFIVLLLIILAVAVYLGLKPCNCHEQPVN